MKVFYETTHLRDFIAYIDAFIRVEYFYELIHTTEVHTIVEADIVVIEPHQRGAISSLLRGGKWVIIVFREKDVLLNVECV